MISAENIKSDMFLVADEVPLISKYKNCSNYDDGDDKDDDYNQD